MIGRIRDRTSFERIARDRSHARAGVLWCTFVLDPLVLPPQVAYAIGRAVGPAVTRNRIRRRLKAVLQQEQHRLPGGLYLIGASPAAARRSFIELQFDLMSLLDRIRSRQPA